MTKRSGGRELFVSLGHTIPLISFTWGGIEGGYDVGVVEGLACWLPEGAFQIEGFMYSTIIGILFATGDSP